MNMRNILPLKPAKTEEWIRNERKEVIIYNQLVMSAWAAWFGTAAQKQTGIIVKRNWLHFSLAFLILGGRREQLYSTKPHSQNSTGYKWCLFSIIQTHHTLGALKSKNPTANWSPTSPISELSPFPSHHESPLKQGLLENSFTFV